MSRYRSTGIFAALCTAQHDTPRMKPSVTFAKTSNESIRVELRLLTCQSRLKCALLYRVSQERAAFAPSYLPRGTSLPASINRHTKYAGRRQAKDAVVPRHHMDCRPRHLRRGSVLSLPSAIKTKFLHAIDLNIDNKHCTHREHPF